MGQAYPRWKIGGVEGWKSFLGQAKINEATAIVICTADDMTNLQIALRPRSLNPNIRVVMLTFDPNLSEQLRLSMPEMDRQVHIPPILQTQLQIGDEIGVMATEEKLAEITRRNGNAD